MTTREYKNKLEQYKGQRSSIQKLLGGEVKKNKKISKDSVEATLANDILTLVGRQTQEKLVFKIEALVTSALEYVYDDPYQFKVEFDTKRSQTECNLYFERDGFKANPVKDSEGTLLDISAISLRVAVWALPQLRNRSSPFLLLDEPLKHVSKEYRDLASRFMKEMCDRLDIQIITVTHEEELIEGSDNIIKIVKDGKYSKVERSA